MAYTINNTVGTVLKVLADGTIDTTATDLTLIGKGYAGFGERLNENFVKLLENFSNTSAPSNKIKGQLWYDTLTNQVNVYTGTKFKPVGSTTNSITSPVNSVLGDMWFDTSNNQFYVYSGTAWTLIGPTTVSGSGVTQVSSVSIADNVGVNKSILKLLTNDTLVATVSAEQFTPGTALSGFATIFKGITLSTAVSSNKFTGTATNADALGGVTAANFLTSNANDTTSGSLGIINDLGLQVGADSDLSITVDASGVIISNVVADTDITFKVNDGGVTTTLMHMDGALSRIGIGTATPSTKLQVVGTVTATAFAGAVTGNVTGDVTGNIAGSGSSSLGATTLAGTLTSKAILPDATTTYDIGSTSKKYNTVHAQATSAQYADLAEIYESDSEYEVGTVVIFGGDKEITVSSMGADPRVAGVISENPAYLMNSDSAGLPVALQGKVKCKVIGVIGKGDMLVTHSQHPGVARAGNNPAMGTVIGKSLENYNSTEIGTINIVAGRI